jgi:ABC-type antimicrobial peptide transport system permease subunit
VRTNFVSPGFFAVSGIGINAGREFGWGDDATSERVAILSEALARRHFAGSPLNATVALPSGLVRVVGVANYARYYRDQATLRDTESEMLYFPLAQAASTGRRWLSSLTLVVRAEGDARAVAPSLQRLLRDATPGSRTPRVTTVGEVLRNRVGSERMIAVFTTLFGALALCLAALGVFATTSHRVAMQTSEIGLRIALGATPATAMWFVLRRTVAVALCACVIGAAGAVAAVRIVRAQLLGVEPMELSVIVLAAMGLLLTAIGAALLPSLRAASVAPAVALRPTY